MIVMKNSGAIASTNQRTPIDPKSIKIRKTFPDITNDNSGRLLLEALWRFPDEKHLVGSLDRQTKRFRNIPVNSINDAVQLAQKLSSEGDDAYFAIAGYETTANRTAANTSGAGGFWMDIDCGDGKAAKGKGYLRLADAESAVRKFCETINIPLPTHTVDSGGGLHIYWRLDTFLQRDSWQTYAKYLKDLTHAHGLLADDSRTADIASVLRLPGTLNHKYEPPRLVRVLHATEAPIHTQTMLAAIKAAHDRLATTPSATPKSVNTATITAINFNLNDALPSRGDPKCNLTNIRALLKHIDPEEGGYDEWVRIGMAIHTETNGDSVGLEVFDQWSRNGSTYPGLQAIKMKWRSFTSNRTDRCNLGTIINRVTAAGLDWQVICSKAEDNFKPCEYKVVGADTRVKIPQPATANPLDSYSLLGMSEEVARDAQDQKPILCGLAVLGQATAIFAPPNSGKTLITFSNICEDIQQGKVEPSKVYYVNVDDSGQGLANKLAIADEFGFHMLSEGYRGFKASDLLAIMVEMITNDQAKSVIVILDTIKKFTNLMDKTKASQFTTIIRQFVIKGGTVIGMAHTNKKAGADGKPVYGGTSDIVDDFDCAYTIAPGLSQNSNEKVVVFENIKRRGNNRTHVAYRYSIESDLSYAELLSSVEKLDDDQTLAVAKKPKEDDSNLVAAIQQCIIRGITSKMSLAEAASKVAGVSKRSALSAIERYTGSDPAVHKWQFEVRERGAKVFTLLDNATPPASKTA